MLFIGIGMLVLAVFVGSLIWGLMFTLGFLGLTVLYIAIAVCITFGIAKHNNKDFQGYLENNNTWFFVLLGASAVTFVIACFNFGPAVLLPENLPTKEQRSVATDIFNHLLYGKGAPTKSVPTESLPWATGTWFWWKALGLYCLLTFGYFWFAFWDEASHAIHAVTNFIHTRKEAHRSDGGKSATTGQSAKTGTGQQNQGDHHDHAPSFGELLKVEFIAEIVVEFVKKFLERRRAKI